MPTSTPTTRPPHQPDLTPVAGVAPVASTTLRQIAREVVDVCRDLPVLVSAPLYRRWHLHWGATPSERTEPLPGDDAFPRAQYRSTRAITIDAPPNAVWPWLVQVGCRRAGFYSNDLLDNLGRPSATTIRPEYQDLQVGQWVPMSPARPTDRTALKVHSFEVNRWLLWSKPDSTWSWSLTPTDEGGTRLVTRIHAVYDWKRHPLMAFFGLVLMEFGDFAMLRKMLRGIKQRSEAATTGPTVVANRADAPTAGGLRPREALSLSRLVGAATIVFTAIYLLSDVLEVVQGDFTDLRLLLTYVGEAAIPLFVIGLYAVQRPRIGRLGLAGATTYAYSYVFFTTTVMYALVAGTRNYRALTDVFGAWMTLHGLIMVLGGVAFGAAVARAGVLPRWTGICLLFGVVAVAGASGLPNGARLVAELIPAIALAGMGSALVRGRQG